MQCIILAGGLGTRVSHRAADRPKAMVEVAGEPFIRHQLRLLQDHGVDDVVICVGHLAEVIEAEVAYHAPRGMTVRCNRDGNPLLGTGGAIRRAVAAGLTDEEFMVLHGDSYLRIDLDDVWEWFDGSRHHALVALWHSDDELDSRSAAVQNGRVVVYRKSSSRSGHPTMNFVDYGLSIVKADPVLELIPEHGAHDLGAFFSTVATRGQLQAYEVDQPGHHIGSPAGIAELDHLLKTNMQRQARSTSRPTLQEDDSSRPSNAATRQERRCSESSAARAELRPRLRMPVSIAPPTFFERAAVHTRGLCAVITQLLVNHRALQSTHWEQVPTPSTT